MSSWNNPKEQERIGKRNRLIYGGLAVGCFALAGYLDYNLIANHTPFLNYSQQTGEINSSGPIYWIGANLPIVPGALLTFVTVTSHLDVRDAKRRQEKID